MINDSDVILEEELDKQFDATLEGDNMISDDYTKKYFGKMYNMISDNVMKLREFDDAIYYRVGCDCMDQRCEATLELELDEDCNMAFLNLYKDLVWDEYYNSDNRFVRFWRRIKCTLRMLFTGRIELESCLVLKNNHLRGFRDALDEGITILEAKEFIGDKDPKPIGPPNQEFGEGENNGGKK